ncbi:MAG: hypothetical protein SVR94_04115 [Pseudomonadota bacterium]|nr:hypothetical protein [Pseudomonadota bacterium]
MSPQPALKTQTLFDEINTLTDNPQLINEFRLAQLKKQVNHVAEPIPHHMARGTIASLEFDIDQVHSQFKTALEASEHSPHVLQSYVIALVNMYFFFEANKLLLQHYQRWPDDLGLLGDTIELCAVTGQVLQGEALLTRWHQLTQSIHPFETTIQHWAEFYRQHGLTETEIQPYLETALSLLRHSQRQHHQHNTIECDYIDFDTDPYLAYTIYIDLPETELHRLAQQHHELLTQGQFRAELLAGIVISFEPFPLEDYVDD